jgi:Domain of unknown function (DUF222)/HNH endonuclease
VDIHEGPGVVPGRYAGPAIPVHRGPTPQQEQVAEDRAEADALAGRICAAAAMAARSECQLLDLIGEFDATDGLRWWTGFASVAHWLAWTCSMSPGVAREHVRVAKALRQMPTVRAAFAEGRLSYSKVREVTRVVGLVEEARLCELALTATAAQLARMISAYRACSGRRLAQQLKRSVSWRTRDDGMVELRAMLPAEEGAVLVAAIRAAKDQFGQPPAPVSTAVAGRQVDTTPVYSSADALLDVARGFLATAPADRSGEDRTLVVLHVSADTLAGDGDVPAETSDTSSGDVPAETPADPTCHLPDVGPVEAETARRFACDSDIVGAVVDRHGDVLALGRTQRFVSRAQRRALMIRDQLCRFPGCARTRHLKAHHIVAWSRGGPTDLNNLILLCQAHHTAVHEGGMRIERDSDPAGGWRFLMPDGTPYQPWYTAEALPRLLQAQLRRQAVTDREALQGVTSVDDPDARTIRPRWAGERFDLHACVQALFQITLPGARADAA